MAAGRVWAREGVRWRGRASAQQAGLAPWPSMIVQRKRNDRAFAFSVLQDVESIRKDPDLAPIRGAELDKLLAKYVRVYALHGFEGDVFGRERGAQRVGAHACIVGQPKGMWGRSAHGCCGANWLRPRPMCNAGKTTCSARCSKRRRAAAASPGSSGDGFSSGSCCLLWLSSMGAYECVWLPSGAPPGPALWMLMNGL